MKTSEVKTIKSSRKKRNCNWCSEIIKIGTTYNYYFCFDEGSGASMHPECLKAMKSDLNCEDGFLEGDNPRGCNCGFDIGCCGGKD